jgi:hypothetical protein
MDHDTDVIRIIEGRRGAIECGVIEIPFRRAVLPDEFCKSVPIFFVTDLAAFRRKIKLDFLSFLRSDFRVPGV